MVSKSNNKIGSILIILLVVIGLVWLFMNMKNKNVSNDGTYVHQEQSMSKETMNGMPDGNGMLLNAAPADLEDNTQMDATAGKGMNNGEAVVGANNSGAQNSDPAMEKARDQSCFPKDQLTAQELLPQNNSSTWAQVNPGGSGTLKDKNFLQAGHHIGINTVGQTLRNANLQLRSEPANPQVIVSPWMQTTINPDMNRKPFEIGGSA